MGNFKQTVSTLGDKIKGGCRYVRTYWSKAPKNRYLSFKEAAAKRTHGAYIWKNTA